METSMVTKIDIAVVVLLCEHQALDLLIKKKQIFCYFY